MCNVNVTLLSWENSIRHLGNIVNSKLDTNVDSCHKCSQFIGQLHNLRSRFGHLYPSGKFHEIKLLFISCYDDIIQMD